MNIFTLANYNVNPNLSFQSKRPVAMCSSLKQSRDTFTSTKNAGDKTGDIFQTEKVQAEKNYWGVYRNFKKDLKEILCPYRNVPEGNVKAYQAIMDSTNISNLYIRKNFLNAIVQKKANGGYNCNGQSYYGAIESIQALEPHNSSLAKELLSDRHFYCYGNNYLFEILDSARSEKEADVKKEAHKIIKKRFENNEIPDARTNFTYSLGLGQILTEIDSRNSKYTIDLLKDKSTELAEVLNKM